MSAPMTLTQIVDILHTLPGIREAFIQETQWTREADTPIKKQGGDGREKKNERFPEFRVVLFKEKTLADVTKEDLGEAIRAAFVELEIEMPEQLATEFPEPFDEDF